MDILVIEDNPLKRKKISDFLLEFSGFSVVEAASRNSGINQAMIGSFDLMVVDMSMPTFDRTDVSHGGRFKVLAGKEIVSHLARRGRLAPFVVLTGYKDFSVNSENLSIEQIDDLLKVVGHVYKGCIVFDAADSFWKDRLLEVIESLRK